ncbi:RyR domain-containing protein [Telluribacter humicola]|uniref:RyR domain-containing protein n=1 Tax=Telluribacter humicola TaxID=1720261 RepID=UPI001A972126|nr:RyR domain-containing protein [Telluribacter humicola]
MSAISNFSTETQRLSKIVYIAMVCHQANKAWCEANDDQSQKDWNEAEAWQKESAIKGVEFRINNPESGESAQHDAWMADKVANGWKYGPVKDAEKKEHHCIVPFEQLPEFQQKKDKLFCAIVDALK